MEFIFDKNMEEYQAEVNRMNIIIMKEVYGEKARALAERIAQIYSSKVEEIARTLTDSEEFEEYYPEFGETEVMLRLGRPTVMIEMEENGVLLGNICYFENRIDENEVIQVEFSGELEL